MFKLILLILFDSQSKKYSSVFVFKLIEVNWFSSQSNQYNLLLLDKSKPDK